MQDVDHQLGQRHLREDAGRGHGPTSSLANPQPTSGPTWVALVPRSPWVAWEARCRNRLARSLPSSLARSGSASLLRLPLSLSAASPASDLSQQLQHNESASRSGRSRKAGCSLAPQLEQHGEAVPALRRALRRAWRSAGVRGGIPPLSRNQALVVTACPTFQLCALEQWAEGLNPQLALLERLQLRSGPLGAVPLNGHTRSR